MNEEKEEGEELEERKAEGKKEDKEVEGKEKIESGGGNGSGIESQR